jgi:tripeptidyl-peptidase-1
VTVVGGTNIQRGLPEWASTASGGGFSTVFSRYEYSIDMNRAVDLTLFRPIYQDNAVSAYLTQFGNSKYAGLYNVAGRGFPDVATVGDNVIAVEQQEGLYFAGGDPGGPIFASIIALLNDGEIAAGRGPLGFLNPWLCVLSCRSDMLRQHALTRRTLLGTQRLSSRSRTSPLVGSFVCLPLP